MLTGQPERRLASGFPAIFEDSSKITCNLQVIFASLYESFHRSVSDCGYTAVVYKTTAGPVTTRATGRRSEDTYNVRLHKSVSNLDVPYRAVMGDVWEMSFFGTAKCGSHAMCPADDLWFNPATYTVPAPFTIGSAVRNHADLRRGNYRNVNLSMARKFLLHER